MSDDTNDNKVRVNIDLNVDFTEFASWRPENVKAFMGGVALCLSAQQIGKSVAPSSKKESK